METTSSPSFSLPSDSRWTAASVAPVLSAWRSSGLSLEHFCRQHGLDAMRVRYHVRARRDKNESGFVAVHPLPSSAAEPSSLTIRLACGATIPVSAASDLSVLRAVVDALR